MPRQRARMAYTRRSGPVAGDDEGSGPSGKWRFTKVVLPNDFSDIVISAISSSGSIVGVGSATSSASEGNNNQVVGSRPNMAGQAANTASTSNANSARHAVVLVPVQLIDCTDDTLDNGNDVVITPKTSGTDTNPQSIAWIDPHRANHGNDPDMPWLVLRFSGIEQMGLNVRWKLKVKYSRPNGRTLDEDTVTIPSANSNPSDWVTEPLTGPINIWGNNDWINTILSNGFFGGDAELTFQLLKADGSTLTDETTWDFRIAGKNPDNTKARDYLASSQPDLWFAYAICKHETSEYRYGGTFYNQFVGNPKGKNLIYTKYGRSFPLAYGAPTWNWDYKDSKPGGFGLFQVTGWQGNENGDVPRDVIWDWQRNTNEGASEIRRDKAPAATKYFNAVNTVYGSNVPAAPNVPTGKSRDLTAWEADVIVRYNGVGGLPTHHDLDSIFGLRYTQDPWTYSSGQWHGPFPNNENYLNKVLPEFE